MADLATIRANLKRMSHLEATAEIATKFPEHECYAGYFGLVNFVVTIDAYGQVEASLSRVRAAVPARVIERFISAIELPSERGDAEYFVKPPLMGYHWVAVPAAPLRNKLF